ncbi:MAG: ferritin family protein [Planctomycetota bacterium]|jgi:rubrerythrin
MAVDSENAVKVNSTKTLGHFLSSALHLEEQFSSSVYRDYLDPEDWPVDLNPDVFEKIRQHLTVLIEDSMKHEQLLHGLARQYTGDENRDKRKIVRELELMEGFELSARDFYRRVSSDPQLEDQQLREVFQNMADAEQRHADIVREIIELVNYT